MSTFIAALVLLLIGFAMFYPIFFAVVDRSTNHNKNTRRFLRLNYLIHISAGLISVLLLWVYNVNYSLQLSGTVYVVVIIVVVLYYWKSPIPRWNLFNASIIFGFIVFVRTIREIVQLTPLWPGILVGVLSAGIVAMATFVFINIVRNKDRDDKMPAISQPVLKALIFLIGLRLLWDLVALFNVKIGDQNGILMNVFQFFIQNTITYFLITVLAGLVIPTLIIFTWQKKAPILGTKKSLILGILLLTNIWFAEVFFKYFLLQYGIVL